MSPKFVSMLVHFLTGVLAVISGILAYGDKIAALPLPPWFTQSWPLVLAAAAALKPVVLFIGDLGDDGIINQSFFRVAEPNPTAARVSGRILPCVLALFFLSSCATDTGDPSADRRGRVTNAVLKSLFNTVAQASVSYAGALAGQNGQDTAQAAFLAAGTTNGVELLGTLFREYGGKQVAPIAQVAIAEIQKIDPKTPQDKAAVLNTVGAAVQHVANSIPG